MVISIMQFHPRGQFKVKRLSPQNLSKLQKWCQIWIPSFFPFLLIPYFSRLDH